MSYWHVDRMELDELFRACPKYKDPLRHNAFSAEKSEHGSLK
jgi:hypothetical protein